MCDDCVEQAEETKNYCDAIRAGMISGRFDLYPKGTAEVKQGYPAINSKSTPLNSPDRAIGGACRFILRMELSDPGPSRFGNPPQKN